VYRSLPFCFLFALPFRALNLGLMPELVVSMGSIPLAEYGLPGTPALLALLRVTKGIRSEYDHLMLGMHDRAKADLGYQRDCPQQIVGFRPGATWLCFSDQVMHAAMSGQHALEQTFHLPAAALGRPETSPLKVLERLTGRALV